MKISIYWMLLLGFIYENSLVSSKPNCPSLTLPRGRARLRSKGRIVRFRCRRRFKIHGPKMAVCINDKWSHPTPVCVAAKCRPLTFDSSLVTSNDLGGAVIKFQCVAGKELIGNDEIYCDGRKWNGNVPICKEQEADLQCDFEQSDLCGWKQDILDSFDWTLGSGRTPTAATGPDQDHTFPLRRDGHYMYIESSTPRGPGDVARLLSPYYDATDLGLCFEFWYHMKGPNGIDKVGELEVFIRQEEEDIPDPKNDSFVPAFYLQGNQGLDWNRGKFQIGKQDSRYQIVIVATRLQSYVSDIAIDDVKIYNCSDDVELTTTEEPTTLEATEQTTSFVQWSTESSSSTSSVTMYATSPKHVNTTSQAPTAIIPPKTTEKITTATTIIVTTTQRPTTSTSKKVISTKVMTVKKTPTSTKTTTANQATTSMKTTTVKKPPTSTQTITAGKVTTSQMISTMRRRPVVVTAIKAKTTVSPMKTTVTRPRKTRSTTKQTPRVPSSTNSLVPTTMKKMSVTSSLSTTLTTETQKTRQTSTLSPPTSPYVNVLNKTTVIPTFESETQERFATTMSINNSPNVSQPLSQQTTKTTERLAINTEEKLTTESNITESSRNDTDETDVIPTNDTGEPNVVLSHRESSSSLIPIKPLMIGLGVGMAVGLIIVVVGTYLWVRRKRRREPEFADEMRPIAKS